MQSDGLIVEASPADVHIALLNILEAEYPKMMNWAALLEAAKFGGLQTLIEAALRMALQTKIYRSVSKKHFIATIASIVNHGRRDVSATTKAHDSLCECAVSR